MKKISDNSARIILLLVIAVIVIGSFRLGYVPFKDKKDALKTENLALEAELAGLDNMIANQTTYEQDSLVAEDNINRIVERYSAGNTPEKSIMILSGMEQKSDIKISTVSFGAETLLATSTNLYPGTGLNISAYTSTLSISYKTSYQGLKDALLFISDYSEHMNVQTASATFDQETGYLSGDMTINLYSMIGTGKEYSDPVIGDIPIGTDNIFGTIN